MRLFNALLVLAVLSTSPLISQAAPIQNIMPKGSVSFTLKPQKFAIWLPKKPATKDEFNSWRQWESGQSLSFDVLTTEVSYSISISEKERGSKRSRRTGLDAIQSSIVNTWGGKLLKRQDLRLNGFTGRELVLNSETDNPARVRLFETPRFSYVIFARADKAFTPKQNAQINRVFDSIRILK